MRSGQKRERSLAGRLAAPGGPEGGRWSRCDNVPVVIVIVDTKERIDAFMPMLDEVMNGGLAVLERTWLRD